MLKISKLADYSTVIMHFLAQHSDAPCSATTIAEQVHIASPTVSKLLKLLQESELLISTRGANGGYQLAKGPAEISLLNIISAIDGQPAVTECAQADHTCCQDEVCELQGNWQFINHVINTVLDSLSLADMSSSLQDKKKHGAQPVSFNHLSKKMEQKINRNIHAVMGTKTIE